MDPNGLLHGRKKMNSPIIDTIGRFSGGGLGNQNSSRTIAHSPQGVTETLNCLLREKAGPTRKFWTRWPGTLIIQYRYNIDAVSILYRYNMDTVSIQYRYGINTASILSPYCIDTVSIQYRYSIGTSLWIPWDP